MSGLFVSTRKKQMRPSQAKIESKFARLNTYLAHGVVRRRWDRFCEALKKGEFPPDKMYTDPPGIAVCWFLSLERVFCKFQSG